mmetsp:Transcript_30712/g.51956  ORF Transcript_30712/g.51956 Transcript_30712/m.51956 type:complete len:205 (+) Transcript_30712:1114-1728(+)
MQSRGGGVKDVRHGRAHFEPAVGAVNLRESRLPVQQRDVTEHILHGQMSIERLARSLHTVLLAHSASQCRDCPRAPDLPQGLQTLHHYGQRQVPDSTGSGSHFPALHHLSPEALVTEEGADPGGATVPQSSRSGAGPAVVDDRRYLGKQPVVRAGSHAVGVSRSVPAVQVHPRGLRLRLDVGKSHFGPIIINIVIGIIGLVSYL